MLALVGTVFGVVLMSGVGGTRAAIDRDVQTALALGQAREALIGRAAMDANRPGSLPCPDANDDGMSKVPEDWTGTSCTTYIGRLPWKTLDLPDLRDGNGDRLWYALSPSFRDSDAAGALNSDTLGTLSVAGGGGTINGVIAIVFSAGTTLAGQERSGAGVTDIANYLDTDNADGDAAYAAYPESDNFNDRVVLITRDNLFPSVERRVAREARYCLDEMAEAMGGRYPWAAPLSHPAEYNDAAGIRFGRVPQIMDDTATSIGAAVPAWPAQASDPGIQCFDPATWWDAWSESIFFHVGADHDPDSTGGPCAGGCLTVNGTGGIPTVVIVAGRVLTDPDQTLRPFATDAPDNYLEAFSGTNNATGYSTHTYARAPAVLTSAPSFNDKVECGGVPAC